MAINIKYVTAKQRDILCNWKINIKAFAKMSKRGRTEVISALDVLAIRDADIFMD